MFEVSYKGLVLMSNRISLMNDGLVGHSGKILFDDDRQLLLSHILP